MSETNNLDQSLKLSVSSFHRDYRPHHPFQDVQQSAGKGLPKDAEVQANPPGLTAA